MSSTFYLKYRPQRASELHLTEVRKSLEKILASKNIPHAWLFTGPRGTGKTSSARILAKAVNCEHRKGNEPCNVCRMCREITAGTAVDVVEIDAASNRGIDEIRNLREKIKLAPMRAKYKVYIIDEVHMLTTEAVNALLKTLEEPPENTIFILCTTEGDKIPETVVSRCTRITFRKPTIEEAVSSLIPVVEGEKLKIEKGVLEMIARAARGSFRDGTKILEQVAMNNREVSLEEVRQVTGVIEAANPEKFVAALAAGKTRLCLESITELDRQGVNLRRFTEILSETFREELLKEIDQPGSGLLGRDRILQLVYSLDRAYEQMKTAAVTQLPLEIWVIENTQSKKEDVNNDIRTGERRTEKNEVRPDIKQETAEMTKEALINKHPRGKGKYSLEDVVNRWPEIMKAVKPKNHSVEALLRSTKPVNFDGEKLELEVFYKFHKDKLETEKCRQIVETSVMEVFSVSGVKLNLKLGQKPVFTKPNAGEDIVKAAEEIFKAEVI